MDDRVIRTADPYSADLPTSRFTRGQQVKLPNGHQGRVTMCIFRYGEWRYQVNWNSYDFAVYGEDELEGMSDG